MSLTPGGNIVHKEWLTRDLLWHEAAGTRLHCEVCQNVQHDWLWPNLTYFASRLTTVCRLYKSYDALYIMIEVSVYGDAVWLFNSPELWLLPEMLAVFTALSLPGWIYNEYCFIINMWLIVNVSAGVASWMLQGKNHVSNSEAFFEKRY